MQATTDDFDVDLTTLTELARALSHPARLAILKHLASLDSCICGDIVAELPLAQATVSQHLKVLREAGLVTVTKRGLTSCYCINPVTVSDAKHRIEAFFGAIEGGPATCC